MNTLVTVAIGIIISAVLLIALFLASVWRSIVDDELKKDHES